MNKNVRVEKGEHGELVIVAAYCSRCRMESLPTDRGNCPWCWKPIVNDETLSARDMLEQVGGGDGGKPSSPPARQLTELPGESWEDIFDGNDAA